LGANVTTGVRHVAFEDVGSHPVVLEDTQAGMVPIKHLENIKDSHFPKREDRLFLEERCGMRIRFQLP